MIDPQTVAATLLTRYVRLVDDGDAEGLTALLDDAELQFGDEGPLRGEAITALFQGLFDSRVLGLHQVIDLLVDGPDSEARYHGRARYVWWRLGDRAEAVAVGDYDMVIGSDDQGGLRLISLRRERRWSAASL